MNHDATTLGLTCNGHLVVSGVVACHGTLSNIEEIEDVVVRPLEPAAGDLGRWRAHEHTVTVLRVLPIRVLEAAVSNGLEEDGDRVRDGSVVLSIDGGYIFT